MLLKTLASSCSSVNKNPNIKQEEIENESLEDENSESEDPEPIESSFNESEGRAYKRGPYKSYSMQEKMDAVNLLLRDDMSITEVSRTLNIPCKNIKRWATEGVFRKRGGGRRRTNPGLEDDVDRWINKHHRFGESISIEEIQEYALSRSTDSQFKASRGWAIKFIDRFNLRSRYIII